MANQSKQNDRGRVERIKLSKAIVFNGYEIAEAVIEIDHINYGLDKTGNLNKKARTSFTLKVDCPIRRHHYEKTFVMVFEHDYHKAKEIYTVTIYPGWEK